MESCLQRWAHPQKLGMCACECCDDLMIPPQCSNTYLSQSNMSMNRIRVCVYIVHETPRSEHALSAMYMVSACIDYVSWFVVIATLLSLIFSSHFNQALYCITLVLFLLKLLSADRAGRVKNGSLAEMFY